MTKALLVEDHEIVRLGLKRALENIFGVDSVAESSGGLEAVEMARQLNPDIIFMDIGLPGMDGLTATRKIKSESNSKIMIITSHDNASDVRAAFSAGAHAYCLKDISVQNLANGINAVMDGALWVDPRLAQVMQNMIESLPSERPVERTLLRQSKTHPGPSTSLTDRETEVLNLVVCGMSNKQMAEQMFLSEDTVKTHLRHVFEKLGVSDRTQAAVKALKFGIVA